MIHRTARTLLRIGTVSLMLGLAACRPHLAAVNDVESASIYAPGGGAEWTQQQVRDKIAAALAARGWGILSEAPGWFVAEVRASGHWAKVRITYDTRSYTITHFESSPGLKYDGKIIHRRYNHWVRLLDDAIRNEFARQSTLPATEGAAAPAADSSAPPVEPAAGTPATPDPSWTEANPSG